VSARRFKVSRAAVAFVLGAAILVAIVVADGGAGGSAGDRPCNAVVERGVIPQWARTGFTDPEPRMPHAIGREGRIAALLFGDPLSAPPPEGRDNKILWVSRARVRARTALRIRAQQMDGTRRLGDPVTRLVAGGPGPSTLDLPAAGCWRLDLTWSGQHDEMDLSYRPRD
jgi:hypothetical protein